jgi:RNA-binding protein YlmH
MIERAEVKDDIKLFWTTECLRARNKELCIYAGNFRKKTRDFDLWRHDIDTGAASAVLHRCMDRVVTGAATDIE